MLTVKPPAAAEIVEKRPLGMTELPSPKVKVALAVVAVVWPRDRSTPMPTLVIDEPWRN